MDLEGDVLVLVDIWARECGVEVMCVCVCVSLLFVILSFASAGGGVGWLLLLVGLVT